MTKFVKYGKTALDPREVNLLVLGLEAGAREAAANGATARRLGYLPQAIGFEREAAEFRALASTARSAGITKVTVQHA